MPSQWTPLGILALPLLALPLGFAPITQIEMKLIKLTLRAKRPKGGPTQADIYQKKYSCHAMRLHGSPIK